MCDAKPVKEIGTIAFAGEPDVGGHGEVRKQTIVLRLIANAPMFRAEVHPSPGVEPELGIQGDSTFVGPLESRDAPEQ